MSFTQLLKWVSIFFLMIGLFSLIISLPLFFFQTKQFLNRAHVTNGVIEDYTFYQKRNSKGQTYRSMYAVIRYIDFNNRTNVFEASMSDTIQIGKTIEIIYTVEPNKKNEARLNDFFSIWGNIIIRSVLGIVFTGVGAVLTYVAWFRNP